MRLPLIPGLLSLALLATACNKTTASAPAPLRQEEIPAAVQVAFGGADDEVKSASQSYVEAVKEQDAAGAFEKMKQLSARQDLSPAQRQVAARAMITSAQQLRAAAQSGDARAEAVLRNYMATR